MLRVCDPVTASKRLRTPPAHDARAHACARARAQRACHLRLPHACSAGSPPDQDVGRVTASMLDVHQINDNRYDNNDTTCTTFYAAAHSYRSRACGALATALACACTSSATAAGAAAEQSQN
jgi:hypothetical protein